MANKEFLPIIKQAAPAAPVAGCISTNCAVLTKSGAVPIYEPAGDGSINSLAGWNALCAAMEAKNGGKV